ncbi:amidase [Blastomyces gilchristii SLH14081]|uniref:Amidase n=1 Tax=Blastomyces gilchristii (strain SLH14081) TaxID=559298 RepID=A0A179UUM1_BLAGS|nr:amidase [Blastomyces gilchristii SLH14081]OAT10751.1 amidase [Blastomyces gilchristii SLH14081]
MAPLESARSAGLLLILTLSLFCLGVAVLGKPDQMNLVVQQPPSVFTLDEATYFVSPSSKDTRRFSESVPVSGPCTVIRATDVPITPEYLIEIRRKLSKDDVWTYSFLRYIIFLPQPPYRTFQISPAAQQTLDTWGSQVLSADNPESLDLHFAPYFCNAGQLHKVHRLYPDTAGAFMSATIQSPSDPYLYNSLNISVFTEEHPLALTIGVPSRFYYAPTEEKPLAGLRIAVKDTQDVRGIKTTGSSRAYARLYGPRDKSATGVQRLLDHGAIVIGKLKSTQFGESEWATGDWVDYHAPWNPRADGYQTPSASSSGSGAAVAAYDWLDLSTGTDCSGSVRAPAAVHGLFAIRPSTDAIDNKGVIPFSKNFDTFGIFTRNIETLTAASSVLYNQHAEIHSCFKKPTRIIYPNEYWPVEDMASSAVFESVIGKLENAIGTKRTSISLSGLWAETNPVGTDVSIDDYFKTTFVSASAPDQWRMLKNFHSEYSSVFGHSPPVNPQLQWKMEFLPKQTLESQKRGQKEIEIFRRWFEQNVMLADENGCSESILVLPWTKGEPSFRDEYRERPSWTGEGWFFYFISVYAGAPEVILPIGQTSYHSRVTQREEWLPVALGLVGARGTDAAFTSFIKNTMEAANLSKSVYVGRTAFDLKVTETNDAPRDSTGQIPSNQRVLLQENIL